MIIADGVDYDVNTSDGPLHILRDVDLRIAAGISAAIVGSSGSGKSTLLGILAGLDTPTAGEVSINGNNLMKLNEERRADIRREHVAFVFQNFQLLGSLTALENVMLPLEVRGHKRAREKAKEYLDKVGLSDRAKHLPKQLSGGEQQRVALARAFACESPIIFADEPTGNLDTATGDKISNLLFELNRDSGTTLVLVTHSEALSERCDKRFTMNAGELREAI